MVLGRFPGPWDKDPAWTDLAGLAQSKSQTDQPTSAERAFIDVLREAVSTHEALEHPSDEDPRACRAQLVLGLAAALARPESEQWAVRWLHCIGKPYLRQWWRHAAPDRRVAGEAQMVAPLTALAGDGTDVLTGDQAGRLQRHDASQGISPPPVLLGRLQTAVWSIAARNGTVVAGGAGNELLIVRRGDQAPPIEHLQSAITAVATDGERVACGFETGQVWLDGTEVSWPDGRADHPAVLALTFTPDSALLCVRADGEVAEHWGGHQWRHSHAHGKRVRAAQWHPSAEMVALGGVDGSVAVLYRSAGAWHTRWLEIKQLSVAAVGWSADGCLASAGYDRRIWISEGVDGRQPRYRSLRSTSPTSVLAFTDRLLITGHGRRLIAWHRSTGRGGRAVMPPDEVTVLGLDPDRPELIVSATSWGLLRQHDAAGRIRHDPVAVPGRVHRISPAREGWYVATSAGLYQWRPGEWLKRIERPSRVVAAGRDGLWVAGCGNRVLVNGDERFRHTTTVVDALVAANGSVITLDDQGELRVNGTTVSLLPPGRRLLAAESGAVLFVSVTDGTVYRYAGRRIIRLWSAGHRFKRAVAMTPAILAIAYSDGELAVVHASTGERIAGGHLHASALAGDADRLAAAAGDEVSLFSLVMPLSDQTSDDPELRVDAHVSTSLGTLTYVATMPDGSRWPMAASLQAQVASLVFHAQHGHDQGRELPLQAAERLKGWLNAAGLRLAADRLLGQEVPLPARLRLVIGDPDLHILPWELAVDQRLFRVVRTAETTVALTPPSAADQVRLLTLRATGSEFDTFGRIYSSILDRFPRGLELQADEVPPVASEPELARLLQAPADVIVLLAHARPRHLTLAPGQTIVTERAAELLAAARPRLVVLAACQSVDLARCLAHRGIPAVIGLRTRESVWALEELLEELLVNLMSGMALEDAFAATLDACVRLPETSTPVLYVNPNAPRPFMLVPPDTGN
jgi:hypothetical protein